MIEEGRLECISQMSYSGVGRDVVKLALKIATNYTN
jgi:hypothetical protein